MFLFGNKQETRFVPDPKLTYTKFIEDFKNIINKNTEKPLNENLKKLYDQFLEFETGRFHIVASKKDQIVEALKSHLILQLRNFIYQREYIVIIKYIKQYFPRYLAYTDNGRPFQNTKANCRGLTFGHLLWLNFCFLNPNTHGIKKTYYHGGIIVADHQTAVPTLCQLALHGIFTVDGQTACHNKKNCTMPFQRSYISGFMIKFWETDNLSSVISALSTMWEGIGKSYLYVNVKIQGKQYLYLFCEGMEKPVFLWIDKKNQEIENLRKTQIEKKVEYVGLLTYEDFDNPKTYYSCAFNWNDLKFQDDESIEDYNITSEFTDEPTASKMDFLCNFCIWAKSLDGIEPETVDQLLLKFIKTNPKIIETQVRILKSNGEQFIDLRNPIEHKRIDLSHYQLINDHLILEAKRQVEEKLLTRVTKVIPQNPEEWTNSIKEGIELLYIKQGGKRGGNKTKAHLIELCKKYKLKYSHRTKQELLVILRQTQCLLKKEKMLL
jgi:hypothetical protein